MSDEEEIYSIVLRVQRVTCEDAYVSVPLTSRITKVEEDGSIGIDAEALGHEAALISEQAGVEWQVESVETGLHEIQQPKPESRVQFDGYTLLDDTVE